MILFDEKRPATLEDVRWLVQNLGRRLEDSCLSSMAPDLCAKCLSASLIGNVLSAVNEITSRIVERAAPKPTFINVEVRIIGSALRIEFRNDGGFLENAGRMFASQAGELPSHRSGLEDIEYHPGTPNRLIGWRKLQKSQQHVLIVARNAEDRSSLRSMLRQNYETTCVKSAAEAQLVLSRQRIDAIVADYDPAYQREEIFQAQFDESPIPVVLMAWPNEFEEFRRHPFYIDQCLQKPISTFALVTAIEIAISSYTRRLIHLANYFGRSAGVLLAGELPHKLPGLKLEVLSGTASYGGGDFALALEGKGFTRLVLADIMGHGLKAKAGAIALSSIVRTLHCQARANAGTLLQRASNIVGNEPAFTEIISTIIVVDVTPDGRLEAASAGHPPVAVIGAETSLVLPVSGPIPGLLRNQKYTVAKHRLSPGDKIAIVTDGIDRQSAATAEFPQRLLRQLAKNQDLPVNLLKAEMEKCLARWLGPAPKDDWTLIIAEYCAARECSSPKRQTVKEYAHA